MGTAEVLAVSPALPVDDLLAHDEGGPQTALTELRRLFPGPAFEYARSDLWAREELLWEDVVLVSTFGPTTLLRIAPAGRPVVPEGMTTFSLSFQSVSMAWGVDVSGPRHERIIALSPGVLDYAEGEPLPFESAFPDVVEQSATYSFDDNAFAAAAAEWMFGCHPLELGPDHRVDLASQPIHAFTVLRAADSHARPTDDRAEPRCSGLRRLFGRR